jgi:hypothetical protein
MSFGTVTSDEVITFAELAVQELDWDYKGRIKYQRQWLASVSRNGEGIPGDPLVVLEQFQVQEGISPYPSPSIYTAANGNFDGTSYAGHMNIKQCGQADPTHYIVTVDYSPLDGAMIQGSLNPLQDRWKISCSASMAEKLFDQDFFGNPVTNSAGEKFDPPETIQDARPLLRITRNEASFSEDDMEMYRLAVNTDTFIGFPPGTCQILNIDSENEWHDVIGTYWTVHYEIQFTNDPNGFNKVILDRGKRQLIVPSSSSSSSSGSGSSSSSSSSSSGSSGGGGDARRLVPIVTGVSGTQQVVTEPVLLNGNGVYIGDNFQLPQLGDDGQPTGNMTFGGFFLNYVAYPQLPFAPLMLFPFNV